MREFSLDPGIIAFIDRYIEVSGLSTATTIDQQRIDYQAIVRHFRYPHPPGLKTRDSEVDGRYGKIAIGPERFPA